MAMLRRIAMLLAAIVLLRSSSVHGTYEGVLECEELSSQECAFAVSSAGARCVLEKSTLRNGDIVPSCQIGTMSASVCATIGKGIHLAHLRFTLKTSLIMAERPAEWIESDECIHGCGLERETYGVSTDALMESSFVDKICSAECKTSCPNIIDIYSKLAAGEGVFLPRLCNDQKFKARRLIADPMWIARNGQGGRGWFRSLPHVINHDKQLDASLASAEIPSQPSPVYGPIPGPTSSIKLKKGQKPFVILPLPFQSPAPPAVPGPAPSPPGTASEVSASRFGDDFEDMED